MDIIRRIDEIRATLENVEVNALLELDTRFFQLLRLDISRVPNILPLDSDPIYLNNLLEFIKNINLTNFEDDEKISQGFWSLKYIYIIKIYGYSFLIFNRYWRKINWKK